MVDLKRIFSYLLDGTLYPLGVKTEVGHLKWCVQACLDLLLTEITGEDRLLGTFPVNHVFQVLSIDIQLGKLPGPGLHIS